MVNSTGVQLPGHPVEHTCSALEESLSHKYTPLEALRDGLQWLMNRTGSVPCLDLDVFDAYTPGPNPNQNPDPDDMPSLTDGSHLS